MFFMTFLFIGIGLATAQTSKVTGLVTSEEDGQPVVGASVLVNGTTLGTITDIDGKFTISNVPSSSKTLRVSYVGMLPQEVTIKEGILKIVLRSDAKALDLSLIHIFPVYHSAYLFSPNSPQSLFLCYHRNAEVRLPYRLHHYYLSLPTLFLPISLPFSYCIN